MKDDKLKDIFAKYDPDMQSDEIFMKRLQRNLNAIESVRQSAKDLSQRHRLALVAAAITGFVAGVTLTLCYPYISIGIGQILMAFSVFDILQPQVLSTATYALISLATSIIAYTAYDVTLITSKKSL